MKGSFIILAEIEGRNYKVGSERDACVPERQCLEQWWLDIWSQGFFMLLEVTEDLMDFHVIYIYVDIYV